MGIGAGDGDAWVEGRDQSADCMRTGHIGRFTETDTEVRDRFIFHVHILNKR